jgi:anti-sigma B factor antagonist
MSDEFLPKPFRCDVAHNDGTAHVRPSGELDMSTVPTLEQRLTELHDAGVRRIVVDLRGLDFMDSTGLTLLARWTLEADRDGYAFALIAGSERIQRLFELTGLVNRFTFDAG